MAGAWTIATDWRSSTGSPGLAGGNFAANIVGDFDVSARRNWWGQPGGPAPASTAVAGGSLDTGEP